MKKRTIKVHVRKGPLSAADKANIEDWHAVMDVKDISQRLNRSEGQVKEYLDQFLANAPRLIVKRSETEEFKRELHADLSWNKIRQEFTDQELVYYENDYVNYRGQFKEGITATEIKQIHQLITLDMYIHRVNKEIKSIEIEMRDLDREYNRVEKIPLEARTPADTTNFIRIVDLIDIRRVATANKGKEFRELRKEHGELLKSLKLTRDQRIKSIEERGNFMAILKELEIAERRNTIAENIGLIDLAVSKERERLSAPHQFADGQIDQALLTADTNIKDIE